jgi:hypothetical protein
MYRASLHTRNFTGSEQTPAAIRIGKAALMGLVNFPEKQRSETTP